VLNIYGYAVSRTHEVSDFIYIIDDCTKLLNQSIDELVVLIINPLDCIIPFTSSKAKIPSVLIKESFILEPSELNREVKLINLVEVPVSEVPDQNSI